MATAADVRTETDDGTPVLAVRGHRADIRLNRPAVHNRIEPADIVALQEHFAAIDADPAIRVVVLTGTGKSFSSGYHLGDLKDRGSSDGAVSPRENGFERLTDALENLRPPTICALNGGVYGGSTDLALACDFRIGVEAMKMFMPAARLGLHYYTGGLIRYQRRLGLAAAKRLFLTAEPQDAARLLHLGFLDEVVPADALAGRVDALAEQLAVNAPLAVQGMKKALNDISRGELDRAWADAAAAASLATEDAREGVTAWHEKRPPNFKGR